MSTVLPSSLASSATLVPGPADPLSLPSLSERMTQDLQLRGLSPRTQEAYLRAVRQLVAFYRRPPDQLKEEEVRDYFLHLKNHKHFAPNSLKIAYCGIRFFFSNTVKRDWKTLELLRVERQRRLPDVLSRPKPSSRRSQRLPLRTTYPPRGARSCKRWSEWTTEHPGGSPRVICQSNVSVVTGGCLQSSGTSRPRTASTIRP